MWNPVLRLAFVGLAFGKPNLDLFREIPLVLMSFRLDPLHLGELGAASQELNQRLGSDRSVFSDVVPSG